MRQRAPERLVRERLGRGHLGPRAVRALAIPHPHELGLDPGVGVVDDADAWIEAQLMGMWYREGADSAWTQVSAAQSLSDKSFRSALPHFSEYALCWE